MSCITKIPLAVAEKHVMDGTTYVNRQSFTVNGMNVNMKMAIKPDGDKVAFALYLRPETCEIYNKITLQFHFGFVNANGNLCQSCTVTHTYEHSNDQMYGQYFYTLNRRDVNKISRYYNVQGDVVVRVVVDECDTESHSNRLLKAIYTKLNGGIVDRMIKELDTMRKEYVALEESNLKLSQINETLQSDLVTLQQSLSGTPTASVLCPVREPRSSAPAPTPAPAPTITEIISRMNLEELTRLMEKTKDAIEEIRRCKICLSSCSVITILPCKHTCMCSNCSTNYTATTCPICRTEITDRINIYM